MKIVVVIFTSLFMMFPNSITVTASHVYPGDLSINRIAYDPVYTNSTTSTIYIKNSVGNWKEVIYNIWRTANGKSSMRSFSSSDKHQNFSILLDTKEFMNIRGEYSIEAYGIKQNGTSILLGEERISFPHPIPIVMYHAIDEYHGVGIKDLFVTPASFEQQMQFLKENGYTLLTFEKWDQRYEVNKPIFITFDDGMKNNKNAFSILQKIRDSSFLPTATAYIIADTAGPSWLSHEDVKEMANSGIFSIQSHTLSHADLPTIHNCEAELKDSKEKIEALTGKPVIAISYPFGHVNDYVVKEAKKYYKFATTTKPGQFEEHGNPDELLLMQRVRIHHNTTIDQFALLVKEK